MKTGKAAIEIIKYFEGLRLTAYKDIVGTWTIGYGDTFRVRPGLRITKDEAEWRLHARIESDFEPAVNAVAGTVVTSQHQFDAMLSLAYNIGAAAFVSSTLAKKHRKQDYDGAAEEFPRWKLAGGKVIAGLVRRRRAEAALYLTPDFIAFDLEAQIS